MISGELFYPDSLSQDLCYPKRDVPVSLETVHCALHVEILPTPHLQNQVPGACWAEKYKVLLSQASSSNWIQAGKVTNVYAQVHFPNET